MADNARKLISQVRNATTTLLQGEVTRFSADSAVVRAQADSAENAAGIAGIVVLTAGAGYLFEVATAGECALRPEPSLILAAGDSLFVSESIAGRVTNVEPAESVKVAVVKNASGYLSTGLVVGVLRLCDALSGD